MHQFQQPGTNVWVPSVLQPSDGKTIKVKVQTEQNRTLVPELIIVVTLLETSVSNKSLSVSERSATPAVANSSRKC